MEAFRNTLVRLINQSRVNPSLAGQRLYNQLQKHYKGEQLHYFNKNIETFQGLIALQEYRNYMLNAKASKSLIISPTLNKVAQSIAEEKGRTSRSDHQQPKNIYQRISVNAQVQGKIGELICLKAQSSQEIFAFFSIDDGVATRKRRRMLLDNGYQFIGIGSAFHYTYGIITVILLATNIIELSPIPYYSQRGQNRIEITQINE